MPAPLCQAPDRTLRSPELKLPSYATDCHAHICGPADEFPYWDGRIYTPPDALLTDYQRLLKVLGVRRAVIVQPSVYADDNRALLSVLAQDPVNFRGVAVVGPNVTDHELERLHDAGVRGLRVNVVDVAVKGDLPIAFLRSLADKIKVFGWHIELLAHANEFPDLAQIFKDFPVDIVLGHLGYVPSKLGVRDAGFQSLLSMMREARAWVKLTGPYRISNQVFAQSGSNNQSPSYADLAPFAHALLEANPARVLWGSDWPHVMVKGVMPNDADLCDLLGVWVPEESLRNKVLVENPGVLYGFDPISGASTAI
jgi:2-pyrone-4,6-dicarboxylate lactonase